MSLPDDTDCDDSECTHSQCWIFRRLAVAVADRERRRIRRALTLVIAGLRKDMRWDIVEYIDTVTRAKKGKRK